MVLIIILRIAILLTFFLLMVEGVAAIIWARWFTKRYVRKHLELEARIEIVEQRTKIT